MKIGFFKAYTQVAIDEKIPDIAKRAKGRFDIFFTLRDIPHAVLRGICPGLLGPEWVTFLHDSATSLKIPQDIFEACVSSAVHLHGQANGDHPGYFQKGCGGVKFEGNLLHCHVTLADWSDEQDVSEAKTVIVENFRKSPKYAITEGEKSWLMTIKNRL